MLEPEFTKSTLIFSTEINRITFLVNLLSDSNRITFVVNLLSDSQKRAMKAESTVTKLKQEVHQLQV